jgi:hypothetical protein
MFRRVHLRVSFTALFVTVAYGAASAQDHSIVYAEDYAKCASYSCGEAPPGACGDSAHPWVGCGEGTGGIMPAIAACHSPNGAGQDGCVVILPKGYVEITSTIDVGDGLLKEGLVVRGHGWGEKVPPTGSASLAGTTLVWSGTCPQGDPTCPVLRVRSTSFSRFEDFSIDGGGTNHNGTAKIGIEVTSSSSTGPAQSNLFRNIYIRDINADPGIGIRVVPDPITGQTSDTIFEDIVIAYVTTGVYQDGGQTASVHWERMQVYAYRTYGMDFEGGIVYTDSCTIIPDPAWDPSTADIYVANDVGWASFQNNYHETKSGKSYEFEAGSRADATLFLNTRVLWFPESGDIIDYAQHGPVTLIGNTFQLATQTNFGRINIHNSGGGSTAMVLSKGNAYATGSDPGCTDYTSECNTVMVISGNTSLESNDDPLKMGAPLSSFVAHEYSHAGLVFESGSLNWKNVGESIKFKQDLNGDLLRLLDGSNNVFAWWSNGGTLHLQKATAGLEFEGNAGGGYTRVVGASNPSVTQTITLPDRTGTALVSGITLSGDVAATLADGATTTTIQSGVVKPSVLNATNSAATGQCASKAAGDQFTWASCGGGAQNLFATIDAPAGSDPVADGVTDTLVLAKGRSISVTGDSSTDTLTVAAESELYKRVQSGWLKAPTATDDNVLLFAFEAASTLTRLRCSTTSNTVAITVYVRSESTPGSGGTQIASGSCTTTPQNLSLSSTAVAATDIVTIEITSATAAALRVQVSYDVND